MIDRRVLPLQHKTTYYAGAMQFYMTNEIKSPVIVAVGTLFDHDSNKLQKLKALAKLLKALKAMVGLPEPQCKDPDAPGYCWHPNAQNLIDLRDWLFERLHLDAMRMNLIKRVMNFVIILFAFDTPWRWIFDSLKDEALKMEWKPRGYEDTWKGTYAFWNDPAEKEEQCEHAKQS